MSILNSSGYTTNFDETTICLTMCIFYFDNTFWYVYCLLSSPHAACVNNLTRKSSTLKCTLPKWSYVSICLLDWIVFSLFSKHYFVRVKKELFSSLRLSTAA